MESFEFIQSYKGILGGLAIAIATVIAMLLNLIYSRKAHNAEKNATDASFCSSIAAELMDNAHNLMQLSNQISAPKSKRFKIITYKQFSNQVYEALIPQLGLTGPSLSFMVVDVYGDILKLKTQLDELSEKELLAIKDEVIPDIQYILAKTVTASVIMYFYADYMSGKKWMKGIQNHRILWLERSIDQVCEFIGKTDSDQDFTYIGAADEGSHISFLKRFRQPEKRKKVKSLFVTVERCLIHLQHEKPWRAQIMLRALSYKLHNTITSFMDLAPDYYDEAAEEEYAEHINFPKTPKKKRFHAFKKRKL